MRLRDQSAALAIAALVMVAGVSCASSESVEEDQIEAMPESGSTADSAASAANGPGGDDPAEPGATAPTSDADVSSGSAERGERQPPSSPGPIEPAEATDTESPPPESPPPESPPPESATPVAAPTVGGLSGSVPIATTITDLVREWDRTNFDLVSAETPGVDRVAAEIEQFASVQVSPGLAFFSARITESAILGGAVNAQGQVMEVVVIVQLADQRSLAAATTTLRLAASHLDGLGSVDGLIESIAMEPVGTRRALASADGALIIERFGPTDGQVFVAFARGVSIADFEARATGLAQAVEDSAGPSE